MLTDKKIEPNTNLDIPFPNISLKIIINYESRKWH